MGEVAPSRTLGIDASQANQPKKTGVGQVSYALIQELKKIIPARVRVVLYSPTPLSGALAALPANWSSRVLFWPPGKFWPQFRLAWEILLHPPDLLFSPAHLLPWISRSPVVFSVYDIGFERVDELYGTSSRTYGDSVFMRSLLGFFVYAITRGRYHLSEQDYHRWAMNLALNRGSRIITCSEFTRNEILLAYDLAPSSIDVVHLAIDKSAFSRPSSEDRIRETLHRHSIRPPFLLFVGRLEVKKNVSRLIECFALLHHQYRIPHRLVLAGMPGNGYEAIRSAIQSRNVEDFVVETGWLPQSDLPDLMSAADLFVFPSLYEGFGLPILEAQCTGTPLACSDIPVMREVAGEGAVFFDPHDPADMAKKIHALLTDDSLLGRCLEQGRKNIERFSWEKTARTYWEIFSKELEADRPGKNLRLR